MKKAFIIIGSVIAVLVLAFFSYRAYTKSFSPAATATYNKNGLEIKVSYCRPSKKGRKIFGGLEPYGKVWRTGANEATEITFNKPVLFGNKVVAAGTYTLFTIPDESQWTIILNSELDQWGAFSYQKEKDVIRTQATALHLPEVAEMFTINFVDVNNTATMQLAWDQTKVIVPIAQK